MATFQERFLAEIEVYLAVSGMNPTRFGRNAMSDPKFVFDLRAGRSPSARTIRRVRDWMGDNPADEYEPEAAA